MSSPLSSSGPFAIRVEGVSKTFGVKGKPKGAPKEPKEKGGLHLVQALTDVSLDFKAGLMHGVIGPEGAGKTTLMRVMLGLLYPQGGSVTYIRGGEPVDFAEIRASVAYMPQQQSLYPDLSISEHLDFFRSLYGIKQADYKTKREELLHITRLQEFTDRPAGKLSGGMYKKLGLMCALLRSPRIVLLDEPTNGVDPISRREFWEMLYRLADQEILIIVTTAYMDEAERCAQVHLLDSGRVVAEGEPRDLLKNNGVRTFDELFLKRAAEQEKREAEQEKREAEQEKREAEQEKREAEQEKREAEQEKREAERETRS